MDVMKCKGKRGVKDDLQVFSSINQMTDVIYIEGKIVWGSIYRVRSRESVILFRYRL